MNGINIIAQMNGAEWADATLNEKQKSALNSLSEQGREQLLVGDGLDDVELNIWAIFLCKNPSDLSDSDAAAAKKFFYRMPDDEAAYHSEEWPDYMRGVVYFGSRDG